MKTMNISKTEPKKTKAWFRLPFMPSGQEIDWAYSTAPGAHDIVELFSLQINVDQLNAY